MIKINTGDIPGQVFVSDVEEHIEFKNYFLNFLNKNLITGLLSPNNEGQSIFNTDYHLKDWVYNSNYIEQVKPIILKHTNALNKFLVYRDPFTIFNPVDSRTNAQIWYQQYKKGDYHGWHRHPYSTFSNVYYVSLPKHSASTSFRYCGKEFEIDVKEGQIITFPSYLEHCSKPNPSDHIKTVISFNLD
jgi:hypothetical protein